MKQRWLVVAIGLPLLLMVLLACPAWATMLLVCAIAGIAAIGHGVSHLVTVAQLLMVGGYTPERLHEVMIGHPTLDEIVPAAIRAPRVAVTE